MHASEYARSLHNAGRDGGENGTGARREEEGFESDAFHTAFGAFTVVDSPSDEASVSTGLLKVCNTVTSKSDVTNEWGTGTHACLH